MTWLWLALGARSAVAGTREDPPVVLGHAFGEPRSAARPAQTAGRDAQGRTVYAGEPARTPACEVELPDDPLVAGIVKRVELCYANDRLYLVILEPWPEMAGLVWSVMRDGEGARAERAGDLVLLWDEAERSALVDTLRGALGP